MFVLRPLCMAHSFVVAGENPPCGARRTRTRACDRHSLTSELTRSRFTVEAVWPAPHPIHEVDAVLAGGRATPTTNSCAGNRDKVPRRKCSQFLELLGSLAVPAPADYTRYI